MQLAVKGPKFVREVEQGAILSSKGFLNKELANSVLLDMEGPMSKSTGYRKASS